MAVLAARGQTCPGLWLLQCMLGAVVLAAALVKLPALEFWPAKVLSSDKECSLSLPLHRVGRAGTMRPGR